MAHRFQRAWVARRISLECCSGEVVVVLGDTGKTRLLTAIAEDLVMPSKRSPTTTQVRGSINVGGQPARGDQNIGKKLGLMLNDIRTVGDQAAFLSGLTLEEIPDPSPDNSNPQNNSN